MDRRHRARSVPGKETLAYFNGTMAPFTVNDYNLDGMSVSLNGYSASVIPGRRFKVDIVVNGGLCVCGLTGRILWASEEKAGVQLEHRNDAQLTTAHNLELSILSI